MSVRELKANLRGIAAAAKTALSLLAAGSDPVSMATQLDLIVGMAGAARDGWQAVCIPECPHPEDQVIVAPGSGFGNLRYFCKVCGQEFRKGDVG